MGKFIKISEKHQEYLINNPNEKHIVDVKLNSGKHLRRRRVNDCSLLNT